MVDTWSGTNKTVPEFKRATTPVHNKDLDRRAAQFSRNLNGGEAGGCICSPSDKCENVILELFCGMAVLRC